MLVAIWLNRLIGLISVLILARLLLPSDYGIATLATIITMFFQILLADGMAAYLIRKDTVDNIDYNTAWTIRILLFAYIASILFFGREAIAEFMKEPKLADVLMVSALGVFIIGFRNIGLVKCRKELVYKPLFLVDLSKKIVGFVVTVSIAITDQNYWALVMGHLAMSSADTLFSFYFSNYRPSFTLARIKEQWDFTKWLIASNITIFFRNKINDIVIPKYLGSHALGLYAMAYQLANIVYAQVIEPISHPLLSSFSKAKEDKQYLSSMFIKAISIISMILMPAYTGLYLLADDIILLVLGNNWLSIIPVFKLLLIFVTIQSYIFMCSSVLTAVGAIKLLAGLNWLLLMLLLPIIVYTAIYYDLETIVLYRTLLAVIFLPMFLLALYKNMWLNWKTLAFAITRTIVATVIMALIVLFIYPKLQHQPIMLNFIITVPLATITYVITLLFFWIKMKRPDGGEIFILDKLSMIMGTIPKLSRIHKIIQRIMFPQT